MTHEEDLYDLLILHNEDDLKGMPSILPILNYLDFLEHPFTLSEQEIVDEPGANGRCRHLLKLTCKSSLLPSGSGKGFHTLGTLRNGERADHLPDRADRRNP